MSSEYINHSLELSLIVSLPWFIFWSFKLKIGFYHRCSLSDRVLQKLAISRLLGHGLDSVRFITAHAMHNI